jgi:DNA polymerase-3 subunit gamma/tau
VTYYLKYRPQTISALDLVSVRRELETILSSGRFSHAYLFAGPRGTGKTSAARILAKVVNCERNKKLKASGKKLIRLKEPCNKCNLCRAITDGNALDLFEIDAASNRGIDDIRELRERIKLAPTEARYKVYIIDEVHMLTTEAFNALLKTLEEPPAHALFVLCTTAPEKLPETVISRCTRIDFHKASLEEVVSSLKKVVKGEKLKVKKGVLEAIAKVVDGSFRDGMKILEQLSLRLSKKKGRGKVITVSDVREVASLTGAGAARRLLTLLADGDVKGAFLFVDQIAERQASLEQFIREVLELLRRLMLAEVGVIKEERIEGLGLAEIRRLIGLFSRAAYGLRTAVIPELPLELAVVEWFENMSKSESKSKREISLSRTSSKSRISKAGVTFSQIQESWPKVLQILRPQNHSLEALLKAAEPKEFDGELLILEVAYPFHKEQLELARHRLLVESAVYKVFLRKLKLRYILRKQKKGNPTFKKVDENISGSVEDEEIIRFAEEVFGTKSEEY